MDWLNYLFYPQYAAHHDLQKAIAYIKQGKYDEAIDLLTRAVHLVPEDGYLYANRGVARARNGEFDAALADFAMALKLEVENTALIHANRAATYVRKGDIDTAIKIYAEALSLGSEIDQAVDMLEQRGRLLIRNNELQRAEANYQEIFRLDTDEWDIAYNGIASIRFAQKDFDGVIENCTKAISINPDNETAYHIRGNAYIKKRNWEMALNDTETLINLTPLSASAYNNHGVVLTRINDLEGALADFETAIEIDPQMSYAYGGIGVVAFLQKKYETALQNFIKSDELLPKNEFTLASLAVTYHALPQFHRAVEIWKKLIEADNNYLNAEWVKQEHTWPDPLVEEARKLIAHLPK